MKINVKEWLAMDAEERLYKLMTAIKMNGVSRTGHKKNLLARECR